MHLDFRDSSTCPFSCELAQHAIVMRGVVAVPHSQRAVARISDDCATTRWTNTRLKVDPATFATLIHR